MPVRHLRIAVLAVLAALLALPAPAAAQRATSRAAAAAARSAPITNVRYTVTFDSATARRRSIGVEMAFDVAGSTPVLLSLPAWTPGAYELTGFARWVSNFTAQGSASGTERELDWDKIDPDTWRVRPGTARSVTVRFDYRADTLDNAMAWSRLDFAFFNGTNLFLYPEGRDKGFPATVTVRTQPDWLVATGMSARPGRHVYGERNYHDLVDMPFFVGRIDYDSVQVEGRWTRLATYPSGVLAGQARVAFWDQIARAIPVMSRVFGETPWQTYTNLLVFDEAAGGSALEHANSHVGVYPPVIIGNPILASITAHEIFHAWNVKRLRPAALQPYTYDVPQPTTLLWVSEGLTDYYADLALVRSGIVNDQAFYAITSGKMQQVGTAPPVALEDASLSTWLQPTDGTAYLYYPKGSLVGLLLDILIRDGSGNRGSLDGVMASLYASTVKAGRGFTDAQFWAAATKAAGGRSFAAFAEHYVDGRDPLPWDSVLPLAGLRIQLDSIRQPVLGIQSAADSAGVRIAAVVPGSMADSAGLRPGDLLVSVGEVAVADQTFAAAFRQHYGTKEGEDLPLVVRRGTDTLTLDGEVRMVVRTEPRIVPDSLAAPKAVQVREGILTGTVAP